MKESNRIRNITDLRHETARVRRSIRNKEQDLSEDYLRMIESLSPLNIITGITGKLLNSAPVLYTVFTIVRSIFRKKK
jgi:hypothetical protein